MNSVRYYFALALVMYAAEICAAGRIWEVSSLVLLGCTIHKSVLLVIPAYIVIDLLCRIRLKKWHYAVGVLLILSLIFGQDVYRNIIFRFYPYYKDSMFDNGQLSYVNIAKCLAVLILCLIYWKDSVQENRRNRYYFYLNLAGLVLYSCGSFIPEVSRVAYYLIQSQIFPDSGCAEGCQKGMAPNPVYYWRCCSISIVFRNAVAGNV